MKAICFMSSFLFVSWLGIANSFCQNIEQEPKSQSQNNYNTFVLFGNEALEEGDFYGASVYFGKALQLNTDNLDVLYKYATALRNFNSYIKAAITYQEVYDLDKGQIYPECLFWLAAMQKNNGQYIEARDKFLGFLSASEIKEGYLYEKAKYEVKSCEYAMEMTDIQSDVIITNLGNQINTSGSEFSPVLSDDSTMYFSSLREDFRDKKNTISNLSNVIKIYKAEKTKNDSWKTVGVLDTVINQKSMHSANGSISPDKKRLYFTQCSDENVCAIFVSKIIDGIWQKPFKLNSDINLEGATATQPMIASVHGEEVLFFVSDRKRGKGKLDIWYSILSFEDKIRYGKAKPVAGQINSKGDEITPYYDSNSNTLYFSSTWHYGYGGYDVFKSYGSYKRFTTPENLGFPYNSSANDFYFSIDSNLTNGFFASNRKESYSKTDEICCNDIYSFKLNKPYNPKEADKKEVEILKRFLPASLYFQNDIPNPKSNKTKTKVSYITTYRDYAASKEKYKEECSKGLTGAEGQKAKEDMDEFYRDHLDKGISDLELFLDLLLTQLQKGKKIELTIRGYASPLAKSDYNEKLTLRRIGSLINYIREVNEGEFVQYMDINAKGRGHLSIIKIPYGEGKADTSVSASLDDQRSSIYSRAAAMERKIEITSIALEQEK